MPEARRPQGLLDTSVVIDLESIETELLPIESAISALTLAELDPNLITAEYRVAKRPKGRILVDYNQNAWGRTLASVYSVRPKPKASVSTPVSWQEIQRGIRTEDFRMDNVPARLLKIGDLWKPLLEPKGRFKLEQLL